MTELTIICIGSTDFIFMCVQISATLYIINTKAYELDVLFVY